MKNKQNGSKVSEVFIVGCVLCGKKWKAGDAPTCGGFIDGKPMCDERELERDISERLKMPNVERNRPAGGFSPEGPVDGSVRPHGPGKEEE